MRTVLLIAATAAAVCATPALAQSYGDYDSRGNPAIDATGLRVEGRIGYERVITELNAETATDSASVRQGKSGVTYGGEVGYDAQIGIATVIGIYGGIEGSSAKECEPDGFGGRICIRPGRNLTAGLRGGFLVSPTTLLYAKGGYSNGQLRFTQSNAAFPDDDFTVSDTLSGFHLGAGIQTSFSRQFYGKLEYVYTDYNGYEAFDGTTRTSLDFARHQVLAGFGVRF